MDASIDFAELLVKTQYSFLEGASSPEEIVSTATTLGYSALGIVDNNGLYGAARTHVAAKKHRLPLIIGTEIEWKGSPLYLFAINHHGYGNLCELITALHQKNAWDLEHFAKDLYAIVPALPFAHYDELHSFFPKRLSLSCSFSLDGQDQERMRLAEQIISQTHLPCIASNKPLYHVPQRKILHDVLRSIQHRKTLNSAGFHLLPNCERYLKSKEQILSLFRRKPEWVSHTLDIASLCTFSLDEIKYRYPNEWLPEGQTSDSYLRSLVMKGVLERFGTSPSKSIISQIEHELSLIQELEYSDYFLTIWDIIQFAKSQHILFQGRGSAANSIVCYLLGITAIDPHRLGLLFERFISRERHEPPDIDIDFEHERREEVIQYIYQRYGRDRAALTAEVICFRKKSALREVGKVLEIPTSSIDSYQRISKRRSLKDIPIEEFQASAPPQDDTFFSKYLMLCQEISGFPRHLGTHVGGFVLSQDKLSRNIPIETAARETRTIVQWDKNDLDQLNFTRVDILGLGILTALRKCFSIIKEVYQVDLDLASIPAEDPRVYESLCKADTVGLFQIESRAQMNMLPRLKPKTFFDLVVQIALVRPGPIQGEMVHPYLKRRQGLEKVEYPHPDLESILQKTYGVPLFQEQIMKMAMKVADFSGGEADELRRAMGIWRRDGRNHLSQMGEKFRSGLINKGISKEFADRIFSQIEGFAEYGFPESHAASFALLAYASAYLKCYYPDAYVTALLNSQPMGFYPSHTLLYDASRHGVTAQGIDINFSHWDNQLLEPNKVRLGFREIKGLRKDTALTIEALQKERPFFSLADFVERLKKVLLPTALTKRDLFFLAAADAFQSIHLNRRKAFWEIQGLYLKDDISFQAMDTTYLLPKEEAWETIQSDFNAMGVSLGQHPMSFLRTEIASLRTLDTRSLLQCHHNQKVRHVGMVVSRQMPPTAKGVLFITLEDEWGFSNLIIWNDVAQKYRDPLWTETFLIVEGTIQKSANAEITHLIVDKCTSLFPRTSQ